MNSQRPTRYGFENYLRLGSHWRAVWKNLHEQ